MFTDIEIAQSCAMQPIAKIADTLGVSKRTVEVRIGKALALLRWDLKDFLPLALLFLAL